MLPPGAIEYLRDAMPEAKTDGGGDGDDKAYDYDAWLDRVFE